MRIAKIPYLNSQPFYEALGGHGPRGAEAAGFDLVEMPPAELGRLAREGRIDAGLIPIADWFAVSKDYERLGPFGIAVSGRVESVLLLSERPLGALSGARIGVTEETSTSYRLLRLLAEARDGARPAAYVRGARAAADAYLVIGDEALAATAAGPPAPFVIDLAEEWHAWQRLPFVFAVWVVRKDAPATDKARLATLLDRSLSGSAVASPGLATHRTVSPGASDDVIARIVDDYVSGPPARRARGAPQRLCRYLARFTYRFGPPEEAAIARFRDLLEENRLG
jgi:predicted solute-binding protein